MASVAAKSPLVIAAVVLACGLSPAALAQTYVDASAPMTGKSRFVFHANGQPVTMGIPEKPVAPIAAAAPAATPAQAQAATPRPWARPAAGATANQANCDPTRPAGCTTTTGSRVIAGAYVHKASAQPRVVSGFRSRRR